MRTAITGNHRRRLIVLLVLLTVSLSLLTWAELPQPSVLAIYSNDMLYATIAFFLAMLLLPWSTWHLTVLTLGFCYAIELSQLIHALWFDAIYRTPGGYLVLGAGFL